MKILVADDNEDARIIMRTNLVANGYEVVLATNGVEALQAAAECAPDIIISDIMMPEMDGFRLCSELKKNPDLKHIPFVFCTATYTEQQDIRLAQALGVSSFLVKPVDRFQLHKIISEVALINWVPEAAQILGDSGNGAAKMYEQRLSRKLEKKITELSDERHLRAQSEDHYQQLIEAMHGWVWQVDIDLNFTYCSPRVDVLLGFEPDEIVGRNLFDLMPLDDGCGVRETVQRLVAKNKPFALLEHVKQHKDGREIYLESHATPIFNSSGQLEGYRGSDHDISERRAVEHARQKLDESINQVKQLKTMGNLIKGIAHDFNQSLMGIVSHTETGLRELPLGHPSHSTLKMVLKEGYRAQRLVSQMLLFNEDHSTVHEPIELDKLVQGWLVQLRSSVPIETDISDELDGELPLIHGDASQIVQLISHLSTNSVQAMPRGGRLHIELKQVVLDSSKQTSTRELRSGHYLKLSVSDTGHGIDQAFIHRIFDPFYTSRSNGEAGLGLAMVRAIADTQRAGVDVSSEPGSGTVVEIYFPASSNTTGVTSVTPQPVPSGRKETVLFVDDEKALAVLGKELLETIGYKPVVFEDSVAALEAFRADPAAIDLVVTDLTMPGLNGFELADKMVAIRSDVPIILLTGYLDKLTHKNVLEGPIKEVLRKPMTPRGFAESIKRVLAPQDHLIDESLSTL